MCLGILSDSKEEDIATISQIVSTTIEYYRHECKERGVMLDFDIESNGNIEFISTTGGHCLSVAAFYVYPDALLRVATLILLCNAFPPFSITRNGRPYSGEGRKAFISRFASLLIVESFKCFAIEREGDSEMVSLKWKGFPNASYERSFLYYVQGIEALQVRAGHDARVSQQTFEKGIAHVSIGLAMAMVICVKEGPAIDPKLLSG